MNVVAKFWNKISPVTNEPTKVKRVIIGERPEPDASVRDKFFNRGPEQKEGRTVFHDRMQSGGE
jgi:hypothetical protein